MVKSGDIGGFRYMLSGNEDYVRDVVKLIEYLVTHKITPTSNPSSADFIAKYYGL